MKFRRLAALAAALLLLAACGGEAAPSAPPTPSPSADPIPPNRYDSAAFVEAGGFLTYTGDAASIVGIDVSNHQGEIDWPRVAAAGVEFAMIRVGYRGYETGLINQDKSFLRNIEGAQAAGLDVGIYFFSQAVTPEEAVREAAQTVAWLEGYEIQYPVVFDWERQSAETSRTKDTDGAAITACAVAFCRMIESAGYQPMVYGSPSKAYNLLDLEQVLDWPYWLAHYTEDRAPTTYQYHFDMWQYSDEGQVDGISVPVDLNLCLVDDYRTVDTDDPEAAPDPEEDPEGQPSDEPSPEGGV